MRLKKVRKVDSKSKWNRSKFFWLVISMILIMFAVGIYLVFSETKPKYIVAVNSKSDIKIFTLDILRSESYEFIIPGDTSVQVARDLGVIKLKNVYKLSQNETGNGEILAETIRNNFYIPVYYWSDETLNDVINGSLLAKIKSLVGFDGSNLNLKERIHILWFASIIKPYQKNTINLSDTGVIAETILTDGSQGFRVVRDMPNSLSAIFAFEGESVDEVKLSDNSARSSQESLSKIAQVLGARIAFIEEGQGLNDYYCRVTGTGLRARELANTFSCSYFFKQAAKPFSIEIELGKKFRL